MIERSDAAAAMGRAKTEKKAAAGRKNLDAARSAIAADPEAVERRRQAISDAQKKRWEKYRQEKAAQQIGEATPAPKRPAGRPKKAQEGKTDAAD